MSTFCLLAPGAAGSEGDGAAGEGGGEGADGGGARRSTLGAINR